MLNTLLAQATAAPTANAGDATMNIITLVLLFAGMYFLVIVPQQQKEKELKKLLSELKKGDEIITIGGVYGKIKELSDEKINLEIANGVVVELQRGAVQTKVTKEEKKA